MYDIIYVCQTRGVSFDRVCSVLYVRLHILYTRIGLYLDIRMHTLTHQTIRLISKGNRRHRRHGCVSCWRQSFRTRFGSIATAAAVTTEAPLTYYKD